MQARSKWTLGGLAVGLVFLGLALVQVDVGAAVAELQDVEWLWAVATLLAGIAFMAVKTWRWSLILRPVLEADFSVLHRAVYIGTAANLMVAHTGEILRSTLVARRHEVAASAVLATVAVERILDFVALLVILGAALVWDPGVSALLLSAGLLSLAIVTVGLSGLLAFLHPTPLLRRLGLMTLNWLPARARAWVAGQLRRGVTGLGSMRRPGVVLQVVGLSVLQWACVVTAVWASARAVGVVVPVAGAIAVFVLSVVGLTLPAAPAQFGTTQLAFVAGFGLVGAAPEASLAASLVYTGFVVVAMMLLGAACWIASDWSPRRRRTAPDGAAKLGE